MSVNFEINLCVSLFQTKNHLVEPGYAFKLCDIKLWLENFSNSTQNEHKLEEIILM